jgi:hypothetical protein
MKNILILILVGSLLSCTSNKNFEPTNTDLVSYWDSIRPLENPDKGWYHHMFDNGIGKYLIQDDKDLERFPGMDHLYLRLSWAYLEPEEGVYDWSYIDDIVEKYVPMGYKISFRISCKETEGVPTSIPYEVDGIGYATPYWVKKAGAKGVDRPKFGPAVWTPDWGDPVYLEKLDNFHKAFAEKYDGKPWVRYVDVGSIGDWGEGHTWFSTRVDATMDEILAHIKLHLKHYKKTQIIVTDDLIYSGKSEIEQQELVDFVLKNGISFRDDSPLVSVTLREYLETWSVRSPEFFEKAWKKMPTIFELEHYSTVKRNNDWKGENGSEIIPNIGVSGAEVFINSMKLIRPTYIGYHGYLGEWLDDNPDLTKELLNLSGYWYFPKSIRVKEYKKDELSFEIEWLNKGVAPAYSIYQLNGKLIPEDSSKEVIAFTINNSDNKNWLPNVISVAPYKIELSEKLKGNYHLAIQLYDPKSERPVELGLSTEIKQEDYFVIQKISF